MRRDSIAHGRRPPPDPAGGVATPIQEALDAIVLRAGIGFALVAGAVVVPLLLLEPGSVAHAAAHVAVPAGWLGYAALTWVMLRLRPAPLSGGNPWHRAAESDPALARFARIMSALMMAGWLASAGGLVAHHLVNRTAVLAVIGTDVPLLLIAWAAAALAWRSSCVARLARADHEARERLRRYWAGLQQTTASTPDRQ